MFAMLVYEVVARCEPHVDKDPNEAAARIRDEGLTPTIPSNCPPKLRELMQIGGDKPDKKKNFFHFVVLIAIAQNTLSLLLYLLHYI